MNYLLLLFFPKLVKDITNELEGSMKCIVDLKRRLESLERLKQEIDGIKEIGVKVNDTLILDDIIKIQDQLFLCEIKAETLHRLLYSH